MALRGFARDLWARAEEALAAARHLVPVSPDAAASRSCYAAFYAVSALFAPEGSQFRKHSAVQAAVHRDLVRPGRWPPALGEDYDLLFGPRETGDYGGGEHVSPAEVQAAIESAERILEAARGCRPELGGGGGSGST